MIAADDPRHGTAAGYVAGCHNECCAAPRRRQRKQRDLIWHQTGTGVLIQHDTFRAVLDPWLNLGISPYAIQKATGVGTRLADVLRDRTDVLRATHNAVAALTETGIPDNAKVYADLTRTRVNSLMAIGHRLVDMPINVSGHWRTREHVTVDTARAIRDYYTAHEFQIGPDRHTAARARNRGARPPLAWDDPGTLAWPTGKPTRTAAYKPGREIDHAVVARMIAGERMEHTVRERREVVEHFWRLGMGEREIAKRCGLAEHNVDMDIRRLGLRRAS